MEVLFAVVGAQAAYAACVAWLWERNDRRWMHIPKKVRRALVIVGAAVAPHAMLLAYLVTKVERRYRRRGRVYAALMDMNRRMKERGAGEPCPRCGEHHGI